MAMMADPPISLRLRRANPECAGCRILDRPRFRDRHDTADTIITPRRDQRRLGGEDQCVDLDPHAHRAIAPGRQHPFDQGAHEYVVGFRSRLRSISRLRAGSTALAVVAFSGGGTRAAAFSYSVLTGHGARA
jgi:hypothetical protein